MMTAEEEIKARVIRNFGMHAEEFVISETHALGADLPYVIEWLHPESQWVCLDVATGGGHVAKTLSPYVKQVVAVDLTSAMLQAAAKHLTEQGIHNVLFLVADAEQLPFLDLSFDVVTCRIAPHHFPNPAQFVREAARVLKPGGRFLMIDNVSPEDDRQAEFINHVEKLRDDSHVRYAAVREWRAWMDASGFDLAVEKARKKVHPFTQWVSRTAESPQQFCQVEQFVLSAPEDMLVRFGVQMSDGKVMRIEVDEWMALGIKRA